MVFVRRKVVIKVHLKSLRKIDWKFYVTTNRKILYRFSSLYKEMKWKYICTCSLLSIYREMINVDQVFLKEEKCHDDE